MEAIDKAAAEAQKIIDREAAGDPGIRKVMKLVHEFIQHTRVMCYGGTAINNIIPKKDQFYDFSVDIPDYDFFSEIPQKHAVELSDRLVRAGIKNVEVKPGIHLGTFKVFADYTGVADISHLEKPIFEKLWKESIVKDHIHYVPPNFLRMSIYLELSRPRGFVERWKKVYTRLLLLNKEYPVECPREEEFHEQKVSPKIKETIEDFLIKQHVILLGFNASTLQDKAKHEWMLPLDLLATPDTAEHVAKTIAGMFKEEGRVKTREFEEYAELLPAHYDIVDRSNKLLVRIYETNACHSYHEMSNGLYIASIPTLLNFFFAMIYADKHFMESTSRQRVVCSAQKLVELANENSKRRFKLLTPITCLGKQKDLLDMKREKSELYSKLSKNKHSEEFLKYFFSYTPKKSH